MLDYLNVVQQESLAQAKNHLSDSMGILWAAAVIPEPGNRSRPENR